jgi:nucleoid DNA-binding protein
MANKEKLLTLVQSHLSEGESVDLSVFGAYETKIMGSDSVRNGVLLCTNKRLMFFAKKMTGFDLESFPYENISSFERSKNLMGGVLRFMASGNTVSMKWISDPELDEFTTLVQSRMGKNPSTQSVASSPAADIPEKIQQLANLRDQGILTEEEFQTKKTELLAQM